MRRADVTRWVIAALSNHAKRHNEGLILPTTPRAQVVGHLTGDGTGYVEIRVGDETLAIVRIEETH